jgi:hypothetical protein
MLKKILIGFAVLLLLLIGPVAFLAHKMRPLIQESRAQAESERKLLQPRLVGEGRFAKSTFYTSQRLGAISQIRVGWPADREGADLVVAGGQGADFLDLSGGVKKQVRFAIGERAPITVARIDASGEYGYLTRDESWAIPATLFDKEGHVAWSSGGRWPGIDDSAPGNVLGDGKLSVVVGFNGRGGVSLLDASGKTVWQKDDVNVWHVETLDTNGDGREEVLHSNAKGELVVRNGSGDVIAHYLPNFYVSHFAVTRWGRETQPSHILVPVSEQRKGCCRPALLLLNAKGKTVAELDSPFGDFFDRLNAIPVRFGETDSYFAVLENNFSRDRSMLLLYGEDGQIAYQELLGESCLGMAALPKDEGARLLIGCTGKIWEYSAAPQAATRHLAIMGSGPVHQ